MKISPRQIASFVKTPPDGIRAVLVFGPDSGLVKEHSETLVKTVVSDLNDPFLIADIPADSLKGDPARLSDEAAAMALTGGRRVVRIRDAEESLAKLFKEFLDNPPGDALIVVSAGDLSARSKLRQAFEGSKAAGAAIPCYTDDTTALDGLVRGVMRDHNIRIDEDAVGYLTSHLGADRGLSRAELEKVALYAGEGGALTLDDVLESIGDSSAYSLDTLIYAVAEGDTRIVDETLTKLWADGTNPVAILRSMNNHILRLQQVHAARADGKPMDAAIKSLRPPVFWKLETRFKAQVNLWSKAQLATAIGLVLSAESDCKRTGIPDRTVCGRTLQQIAAMARRQKRR